MFSSPNRWWNLMLLVYEPPVMPFLILSSSQFPPFVQAWLPSPVSVDTVHDFHVAIMLQNSYFFSVQFSSVAQSCLTLCDPMDCSMPDFPVHHQLPKLAQTYVHRVSDAIQPSHPVLSPSPPALQSFPASGLDTSFSTKNVMLWCFAHVFIFFIRQQLLKLRVSVSVIFIWSML